MSDQTEKESQELIQFKTLVRTLNEEKKRELMIQMMSRISRSIKSKYLIENGSALTQYIIPFLNWAVGPPPVTEDRKSIQASVQHGWSPSLISSKELSGIESNEMSSQEFLKIFRKLLPPPDLEVNSEIIEKEIFEEIKKTLGVLLSEMAESNKFQPQSSTQDPSTAKSPWMKPP
jgi:hypothetical protein